MSFSGTQDKCKACEKTVHFIDVISADGSNFHKTCFKCSHCNGRLAMSTYSSMDGVLYCKPHFEQLFKETGSFTKNFHPSGNRANELVRAPSKVSSMFSGTVDKCAVCNKTVYPLEKITVEGEFYHKQCFRCSHGGCCLTTSSYAAMDGILYCKHHFAQLFKEKGNYSHLIRSAPSFRKNDPLSLSPPEKKETRPKDEEEEEARGENPAQESPSPPPS